LRAGSFAIWSVKNPDTAAPLDGRPTGTHRTLLYRHGGEWQPITGIIWSPSEKTSKIGQKHPEFFCFSAFRHRQNRQAGLSLKL